MLINTSKSPITFILVLLAAIGAINWGLIGLFNFNLVSSILGEGKLAEIIYILVGISGVYVAYAAFKALLGPSVNVTK